MEGTRKDTALPASRRTGRTLQNGAAIRALREKDGWSQAAFVREVGITQPALSQIENESVSAMPVTLNRIARAMRVPVAAIMRECEEVRAPETNGAAA